MATKISSSAVFGQPTDIQRIVTPDARGYQCVLRYRLNVDLDWQTVEGIGVGKTEAQACATALDLKQAAVLSDAPTKVSADRQMVCSDFPDIRVRPVRIGEVIWESETDVHTIPEERPYFVYKSTQCRLFVERNSVDRNFFTYQGVICRLNATKNSKWQVVDKY
jgi:hypothetical protein